jgi:hypothetical protein
MVQSGITLSIDCGPGLASNSVVWYDARADQQELVLPISWRQLHDRRDLDVLDRRDKPQYCSPIGHGRIRFVIPIADIAA